MAIISTAIVHLSSLTPQNTFFFIKIAANRCLNLSEVTHVRLPPSCVLSRRVYGNISRLFIIDFVLKNNLFLGKESLN